MKKLYRSRREKVFGGVCGGLGVYFDIDPVLVRIIFVVAGLFHGLGIIAYVLLWIIIPEEPFIFPGSNSAESGAKEETSNADFTMQEPGLRKSNDTGRLVAGIFLIGIGLLFLSHKFFYFFHFRDILPFGLLLLGVILIVNSFRR